MVVTKARERKDREVGEGTGPEMKMGRGGDRRREKEVPGEEEATGRQVWRQS